MAGYAPIVEVELRNATSKLISEQMTGEILEGLGAVEEITFHHLSKPFFAALFESTTAPHDA